MAVPDFQNMMLPFLKIIADGKLYDIADVKEKLADYYNLSENDRNEKLKSGQNRFYNRVAWIKSHFNHAKMIDTPERGKLLINSRGIDVLNTNPTEINIKYLMKFKEFQIFKKSNEDTKPNSKQIDEGEKLEKETPTELIESAIEVINSALKEEIYDNIMKKDFSFFENLVIDLLGSMGYGKELEDRTVTKKTRDEGIDGIIKEDKLGLSYIYVQVKRWKNTIGTVDIKNFVGALSGKKSKKGIFVTTSNFSSSVYEFLKNVDHSIILIDKEKLLEYMINYNVGVHTLNTYEIKKIDLDYFEEV